MPLTREHVVWAAAVLIEKHYGNAARRYIAETIRTYMEDDDIIGVELWDKIDRRLTELRFSPPSIS